MGFFFYIVDSCVQSQTAKIQLFLVIEQLSTVLDLIQQKYWDPLPYMPLLISCIKVQSTSLSLFKH